MQDARVQLPSFSMWAQTSIYDDVVSGEPVIVFGLLQDALAPDATDMVFIVPRSAVYRLDLISQSFYGVPDLWHVIASVNDLIDPIVGFSLGDKIRIPTKARLAQEGLLSV